GGVRARGKSSGIAAVRAALMLLSQGDHIVMTEVVYGGTYRFVTKVLPRFGISHTFVDVTDIAAVDAAITPATKLLYMVTPSNPTLGITDIRGVVELAKQHKCLT
ncbi:PLP-dependent transferase, partial [Lysinibacillus sp. D4A3_S15]|uniref:PLP-dependent transferase n=1 Tax=Lysinibacillus sp. D4A3_S15 TaxID=2941227 RepID=UPI0020BF783B